MAEVWSGQATGPNGFVKPVAIKFILEAFSNDPQFERLFVNEARLAAQLQHPNLVAVFDFDKVSDGDEARLRGRSYIVMELIEGQDLRRLQAALQRDKRLMPVPVALFVVGEILKALRYVHEVANGDGPLGLIHRDVSPHNVMLDRHGGIKLSDFGIAKAMSQSLGTRTGTIRGKLAYASPEQIRGETVDATTDQFAAGVILWELLAGRRLFEGGSDLEVIASVARCSVPPLAALGQVVHPQVEAVARRMLAPSRSDRFRSSAEALAAVRGAPGYVADCTPLAELIAELMPAVTIETGATEPLRPVGDDERTTPASDRKHLSAVTSSGSEISLDVIDQAETLTRVKSGAEPASSPADEKAAADTTPAAAPPFATASRRGGGDLPELRHHRWWQSRVLQAAAVALTLSGGAAVALRPDDRVTAALRTPLATGATQQEVHSTRLPVPVDRPSSSTGPNTSSSERALSSAPSPAAGTPLLGGKPSASRLSPEPPSAASSPTEDRARPRRTSPKRQRAAEAALPQSDPDPLIEARTALDAAEYPRAVREVRRALQAGAGAPALVLLGDALAKLGRTEEAKQAYADALRKDPNNAGAQRRQQLLDTSQSASPVR